MFGVADLPNGVRLRATTANDSAFERDLHDATRQDLALIDAEAEYVREVIDLQHRARDTGHGTQYPNALYYIIEKNGDRIGRLSVDVGHNAVHIIDLAVLPAWQNQGVGKTVLEALQNIAGQIAVPLTLAVATHNQLAMTLYTSLGFVLDYEITEEFAGRRMMRWDPTGERLRKSIIMPG
jgi:ribosomal protein S18 acetylase RimI-like enzyme